MTSGGGLPFVGDNRLLARRSSNLGEGEGSPEHRVIGRPSETATALGPLGYDKTLDPGIRERGEHLDRSAGFQLLIPSVHRPPSSRSPHHSVRNAVSRRWLSRAFLRS